MRPTASKGESSIAATARERVFLLFVLLAGCCSLAATAQQQVSAGFLDAPPHDRGRSAVFWLEPVTPSLLAQLAWTSQEHFRLLQKNRAFSPHLLVVPVGATVAFPNADPFFHNVFSLYDGKRFDLGLYEAGSSRNVRFEKPGISYIFCNIHPDMSAVVIALQTRLWTTTRAAGRFLLDDVPEGEYNAHIWAEGEDEQALARWTHQISVHGQGSVDAGAFRLHPQRHTPHTDLFGHPYKSPPAPY